MRVFALGLTCFAMCNNAVSELRLIKIKLPFSISPVKSFDSVSAIDKADCVYPGGM